MFRAPVPGLIEFDNVSPRVAKQPRGSEDSSPFPMMEVATFSPDRQHAETPALAPALSFSGPGPIQVDASQAALASVQFVCPADPPQGRFHTFVGLNSVAAGRVLLEATPNVGSDDVADPAPPRTFIGGQTRDIAFQVGSSLQLDMSGVLRCAAVDEPQPSKFDCVATYHQNPLTCGVAKFNKILAEKLNVPLLGLFDAALGDYRSPLLSIKCSEMGSQDLSQLLRFVRRLDDEAELHLFLHDFSETPAEFELIDRAANVYCGNHDIYRKLEPHAKELMSLWSPSTLRPQSENLSLGEIVIFSFGMAHKLQVQHYFRVRDLLESSGRSYTILLSAALHEGTSFEDAFSISYEQLRSVFGEHIKFLGFLSDDAVLDNLRTANFFTAFFGSGVRENNSSVLAAMEQGCVVITNCDENSPGALRHGYNILDVQKLDALPSGQELRRISENARLSVLDRSWDEFMAQILRK